MDGSGERSSPAAVSARCDIPTGKPMPRGWSEADQKGAAVLLDALEKIPLSERADAVALFAKAAIETDYLAGRGAALIDGSECGGSMGE